MTSTASLADWPHTNGLMAGLIRQHDWADTAIGPVATWPASLRMAVDMMLSSGFVASVAWGPDLIVMYNDEMAALIDDHHPRHFGQPLFATLPSASTALYADRCARVRQGETVAIDPMHYARHSKGTVADTWLSARYLPLRDETGKVAGIMLLATDITARVQAEHASRTSDALFETLVASLEDVFYVTNLREGRLDYLSPSFEQVWGRPASSLDDLSRFIDTIHPDDHDRVRHDKRLQAAGKRVTSEYRMIRPDGDLRWILDRSFPVPDAGTLRAAGIASDITARKRSEERLSGLFAELQHRTRNLMGVVRSMFEKSLERAPDLATFAATFRERLSALSRVQGLLAQLDEGDRITFDALLHAELSSIEAPDPRSRITLNGPEQVRLRSSTVQTFALALHELAANAQKHGALSQPEGRLTVNWHVDRRPSGSHLVIDWVESGVTPLPAGPPGYGRELIERSLPYQIDAPTLWALGADGAVCHIDLPIPDSFKT